MEVNFRLILIIISVIAILGIYINGRYKIRKGGKNPYKLKTKSTVQDEPLEIGERQVDADGFDQDGIRRIKTVIEEPEVVLDVPEDFPNPPVVCSEEVNKQRPSLEDIETLEKSYTPVADDLDFHDEPAQSAIVEAQLKVDISEDVVASEGDVGRTEHEPDSQSMEVSEPALKETMLKEPVFKEPAFKEPVFKEPVFKEPVFAEPDFAEQDLNDEFAATATRVVEKPKVAVKPQATESKATAPKVKRAKVTPFKKSSSKSKAELKRDQLNLDFEEDPKPKVEIEQEVLALSVVCSNQNLINGAALLPQLITLGLKFGEMNIFHRHKDNAGNGPVHFSLANMVNPGTFDVDNMERFTTQGLTLFMTLPNAGDPAKVFQLMLSAARHLAKEFNGQVLDSKRSVMTAQTEQHYISKIREFDRRSRLAQY